MHRFRPSAERGTFDHGWLRTAHTFSFGEYHDERHMGFRALRVINEDGIAPGEGFPSHPHRNMEILTYVVRGALEHRDSMGSGSVIRPGDVQYMSAASGVFHSEFNASKTEELHLLQIWILPRSHGGNPVYSEAHFSTESRQNRLCPVASPDGREGSISIRQDVVLFASLLDQANSVEVPVRENRHYWIQLIWGGLQISGSGNLALDLGPGDGLAISDEERLVITAKEDSEFLLFDLA
jgi:redox-sensitive bicupin YhaK (pirin superfamily)